MKSIFEVGFRIVGRFHGNGTDQIRLKKRIFSLLRKIHSIDFYLKLHTCKWARNIFMAETTHDSDRELFIYLQK